MTLEKAMKDVNLTRDIVEEACAGAVSIGKGWELYENGCLGSRTTQE
jgi:hypothetical protein